MIMVLYAGVSLLIGGLAATYEIWHKPTMLDNADGRGKYPSPKIHGGELFFLALFVSLLWPLMVVWLIADELKS